MCKLTNYSFFEGDMIGIFLAGHTDSLDFHDLKFVQKNLFSH